MFPVKINRIEYIQNGSTREHVSLRTRHAVIAHSKIEKGPGRYGQAPERWVFVKAVAEPYGKLLWREYQAIRHISAYPWLSHPKKRRHPPITPRIIQPFIFIPDKHRYYLVVEHLRDPNARYALHPLLENQAPLGLDNWLIFFQSFCSAVRYIHRRGVYHCDLTPEHVWINEDCSIVRLIDFSMSVSPEADEFPLGGTDAYSPPELFSGGSESLTPSMMDSYGLATTLYFALTGKQYPMVGPIWCSLTDEINRGHIIEWQGGKCNNGPWGAHRNKTEIKKLTGALECDGKNRSDILSVVHPKNYP